MVIRQMGMALILFLALAIPAGADVKDEKALKPHAPITVVNDEAFEDLAAQAGSGVTGGPGEDPQHPYVIENLRIAHDGEPGILLRGTTAYCVIRNVATEGVVRKGLPSKAQGLRLENAENVAVSDCRLANDSGVGLQMCYKDTLDRVEVRMGTVLLYDANRCTLTDCRVVDSVAQGYMIWHGKKDVFRRCQAVHIQREGIAFNGSAMDCEVSDCVFDRCVWAGISLEGSPRFTLRGNRVSESRGYGIVLAYGSDDLVVEGNTVDYSGQDGIQLQTCRRARIQRNTVRNSGSAGIFFLGSEDSRAAENTIEQANTGISVTGGKAKNVFEGNTITHCMNGIAADGTENALRDNTLTANRNAINLTASASLVEGNAIGDSIQGISFSGTKNTVRKNTLTWMGSSIQCGGGTENEILENTLQGFVFGGIWLTAGAAKNRMAGNTLEGGRTSSGAIVLEGATENRIEGNTFTDNPTSISATKASNGNTISGNRFTGAGTGISLADSTGNTITGNHFACCETALAIPPRWLEQNKVDGNDVGK